MSETTRAKQIEALLKEDRVHLRWVANRHCGTKLGTVIIFHGRSGHNGACTGDRYGEEALRITGWEHGELLKAGKIKYIRLGCYGAAN